MKVAYWIPVCGLALALCARPAWAQTMVEYGAAAGASAGAAASAKGAAAGIAGALDSLNKTLKKAEEPAAGASTSTKAKSPAAASKKAGAEKGTAKDTEAAAAPAPPRPSYEDAMGIQKGMSCDEVARRFGPPAMSFSTEDGMTMSYASKAGGVQAECVAGKVATVDKPQ